VTLDADEHERVVAVTVEEARTARRPIRVIAGCGSNDTRKSQKLAERCRKAGADALLVVTPYYNKPTPRGLVEHFKAVADAGHLPLVAYNVPGRTGLNMLPETVLQLAEDPRVCAVKEASGSLDQACEILRNRPAGFSVLSGEDSLALPMIACGADGVIAVVSNEAPDLLVALVEAALTGERDEAARLQAKLFPLMRANFRESNPIPVKWALHRLGLIQDVLRLPLVPLSKGLHKPLEEALREAGLLDEAGDPVGEAP
jgi:4-hydroxy-tetrahydrodipicolinate synthase